MEGRRRRRSDKKKGYRPEIKPEGTAEGDGGDRGWRGGEKG